ncbi:hypothetical protein [Methylocapsa acidiphila]|uniref:hypothetical protein n=1 Tax=Methylocapsa acidiphila TaxID=133552 RepID=UPI000413A093|nr:hypothetical protein [Methylocapsa acidiphila]
MNDSFTSWGAVRIAAAMTAQHALEALDGFATFKLLHLALTRVAPVGAVETPYLPAYSERAAQFYIENRERMLFLAKQSDAGFASFLQPIIGVDGKEYAEIERAHAALMTPTEVQERAVFYGAARPMLRDFKARHEDRGVCVADLSDSVFKGRTEPLYADDGHLLPEGNKIVAQRIMAELRSCQLLPF